MTQSTLTFEVYGEAAPQGSKARWGAEDNKRTKPWREQVAQVAGTAMRLDGLPLYEGPIAVYLHFFYARPKSHYGSGKNADLLKTHAPIYKSSAPDADKLVRACGDAMKGVVYHDDAQIAMIWAEKRYSNRGEGSYARIEIHPL